ncbi:MAG: DnaJ domain-containing protein [Alphaproteobacteria bacterium]
MPRIFLKPQSAEFDNQQSAPQEQLCDMPNCTEKGEHRAPKDRGLNEYYHFCTDHARDYNKAWNFFDGMTEDDIQQQVYNSMYGDRPTWKYGVNGNAEEALYERAWKMYGGEGEAPNKKERERAKIGSSEYSKEHEAMAVMGLAPPLTFNGIKLRYRELALKHHPDRNQGCEKSEDILKDINMAYTILKAAYEKYDKMDKDKK